MRKSVCILFLSGSCITASAQNIIDHYLSGSPTYTVIANAAQQISQPRDLDFKPNTNELWILNRGTANGGTSVIIYQSGESTQTTQYRKDSHSGHFMIYPSAMAFGDNGEFASTNEIQNTANANSTFMGPTLWSADTAVYARVFQNNWVSPKPLGSHLDMLHQSPFSMGIAHDTASIYWVFDGYNGNLCKYDFGMHHSPGYDDHSNGRIWRYTDVTLTRQPNIPGHMIKDKATGWLYIVDAGSKKLKRVNTNTGSISGNLNVPVSGAEPLGGYWAVTGATVEEIESFTSQPCGIDLYNGRLIVGDNQSGDIHVYDVSGSAIAKLGVIATGQSGMMGLKIGHDGKIWFVNNTQNTVIRIDPSSTVNNDVSVAEITSPLLYNFEALYHDGFNQCTGSITPVVTLRNAGSNTLTSADIHYRIDNGPNNTFSWTGSLTTGAVTSVTLPTVNAANGRHKLTVTALNPNNVADENPANNTKEGSFRTVNPSASFPFNEDFTNNAFPPAGWTYLGHNFHQEMTHTANVGGGAVRMDNNSPVEDISGQRDYLITPRIDFSTANTNAGLSFRVAYAQYDASTVDALTVRISTDCGDNWTQIYHKSGSALATAPNTQGVFVPSGNGEWRTESVSLGTYAGTPDVMIQFMTTSGWGNNLYLDDIILSNTTSVAGHRMERLKLYPNPAQNYLTLSGNKSNASATISIFDVMGKQVKTLSIAAGSETTLMDISDLTNGNYIVRFVSGDYVQQEKITIIK